jgi:flagellar capping protein FliD
MAVKEDALWRKFAKMEQALSKMYSMQSWLSSTFTGMSS